MAAVNALYLRLSVDDDNRGESESIANQHDLLSAYVAADPVLSAGEVLTFADDGWSGTNFERPQVQELLDMARRGKVSCILVKDLSRWGRNYPEVSEYLDNIFPFLGIRFISVNDHYDSAAHKGQTTPMDVAFGTIMHDVYSKELSVKVRQSYVAKAKNGEFLSGSPPFGFVKSDTERNKLEVDPEAADVVRRIFSLACEGYSRSQIAALLNEDGVDTPLMYRKRKGMTLRGNHSAAGNRTYWTGESIRKILIDERYAGVMVTGKQRISSPESRVIEYLPKSEWIRIPGSHEAIVSEEVYKQALSGIRTVKKPPPVKNRTLFSGKVKCGCCGRSLDYATTVNPYYYCEGARVMSGLGCFDGRLGLGDLSEVVIATVKTEARKVLDIRLERKQQTQRLYNSLGQLDTDTVNAELKKLSTGKAMLERRGITTYEELAEGKIDKDAYGAAVAANSAELVKIRARIDELNVQLAMLVNKGSDKGSTDGAKAETVLQAILNADSVTDDILSLIDRITVFDTDRIEVCLSFADAVTSEFVPEETGMVI